MKEKDIITFDYDKRIHEVLDTSWKIFKSQFLNHRHGILKEAPFQHHFADIISKVGTLFSLTRQDTFLVDLETKCENIRDKTKYIDISCEFFDKIKCAIELKFKLKKQGAQDWGRIDTYVDIESLELITQDNLFDCRIGKFYLVTNDRIYVNQSSKGVGAVFCTYDGFVTTPNKTLNYPDNKGRREVFVTLQNQYIFNWEQIDDWYFLDFTIIKPKPDKAYTVAEKRQKHVI